MVSSILKGYRYFAKYLYKLTSIGTIGLILIMFILINLQVFLRGVGISLAQTAEISRYALVYLTLWGMSTVFREGGHLKTDFLVKKFPQKARDIIDIIICLLIIYFAYLFVTRGFRYAVFSQTRHSPVGINYYYITLSIPTGGILLIIQMIDHMIEKYLKISI